MMLCSIIVISKTLNKRPIIRQVTLVINAFAKHRKQT